MNIWGWIGRLLRVVKRIVLWLVLIVAMLYLLNYSSLPLGDEWTQVAVIARDEQFDYVGWEINALAVKAVQTLYGLQPFMDETARSAYVRSYMNDLGDVQRIEVQIAAIYADPTVSDPAAASADLRAQRDTLRADLRDRQALAEAILEGQVAAVLVDQGFGLGRAAFAADLDALHASAESAGRLAARSNSLRRLDQPRPDAGR